MRYVALLAAILFFSSPIAAQSTSAQLAQQTADAALRVLNVATTRYATGLGTADDVGSAGVRWFQARKDTGISGAALIAAAQDWVTKMRAFEQTVQSKVQSGAASTYDSELATFYRLQAETQLARLRTP